MNKDKVITLTGWWGLVGVIFFACEVPLWFLGEPAPQISDAVAYSQYLASERMIALTRILLDLGLITCFTVFFVGFRHLISKTNPDYEWAGTLSLVAGALWMGVTLVADGLEGGAVLDTLDGKTDPTIVRALVEATLLIYNGSIAFMLTAFFMGAAGYTIEATGALAKWIGWFAWLCAILCIVAIPSMYAPTVDSAGVYNVGGWGNAIIANFPPLLWFLIASIAMIRHHAPPSPIEATRRQLAEV